MIIATAIILILIVDNLVHLSSNLSPSVFALSVSIVASIFFISAFTGKITNTVNGIFISARKHDTAIDFCRKSVGAKYAAVPKPAAAMRPSGAMILEPRSKVLDQKVMRSSAMDTFLREGMVTKDMTMLPPGTAS